jgi:mannose-6-phosphate isomerase-like protein (cupin superfamily)
MLVPVRRIITGHDEDGRSIVIRDDTSPHIRENPAQPNRGLTDVWRTFEPVPGNVGDADAAATDVVLNPPANGTVFRFFQIPPEADGEGKTWEERQAVANAVFEGMGAGHNRDANARHPGMHKTETVDYIVLLSGVVTLILDDGEVEMKPMDVVVQRGTNHSWANRGSEPAVLAGVLMDAVPT